jgi:hypothetical protein
MHKITSFLFFLTVACCPLYQDVNTQHTVTVKQTKGDRHYLAYRVQEELERRLQYCPSQLPLILSVELQEDFHSLVHFSNVTEARSLGDFFVKLTLRTVNAPKSHTWEFRCMAAYTPDPYQEFANIQARYVIETQMVSRLSEEIMMRISAHSLRKK